MPGKRRSPTRPRGVTQADISKIHRIFDERREWLEKLEHTCSVQFARIAQIQAELDEIRRAWLKAKSKEGKKR